MSVGLIVTLIVLIAVVLTLVVNDDDNSTVRDAAPAAPLSYYVDGQGDGILGGHDQAVIPALKSYTGEFQGEGRLNTAGGLDVNRPMSRYEEYAGEGRIGGHFVEGDVLAPEEQARLAHDEMLFKEMNDPLGGTAAAAAEQARRTNDAILFDEWNDTLGWQALSEPPTVMLYEDILFLEQNGVYDTRSLAVVVTAPTVISAEQMRFIEMNTLLPGWSEGTTDFTGVPGFTEN